MKNLSIAILLLTTTAAFAVTDKAPSPPTCGKTAEECQRVVDSLNKQINEQKVGINFLMRQRDQALSSNANTELNAFMQTQQTPAK